MHRSLIFSDVNGMMSIKLPLVLLVLVVVVRLLAHNICPFIVCQFSRMIGCT